MIVIFITYNYNMTSFKQTFRTYLVENNIDDCIGKIVDVYFSQNKIILKDWHNLLIEWVDDYCGNIDIEESDEFLKKYSYRKALFEYNKVQEIKLNDYVDNQNLLNRNLISLIVYKNIYKKLVYTRAI